MTKRQLEVDTLNLCQAVEGAFFEAGIVPRSLHRRTPATPTQPPPRPRRLGALLPPRVRSFLQACLRPHKRIPS